MKRRDISQTKSPKTTPGVIQNALPAKEFRFNFTRPIANDFSLDKNPARNQEISEIVSQHNRGELSFFGARNDWGLSFEEIKGALDFKIRVVFSDQKLAEKIYSQRDFVGEYAGWGVTEVSKNTVKDATLSYASRFFMDDVLVELQQCVSEQGSAKDRLSKCLKIMNESNGLFQSICDKYEGGSNLTSEYKIYCLEQELNFVRQQLSEYKKIFEKGVAIDGGSKKLFGQVGYKAVLGNVKKIISSAEKVLSTKGKNFSAQIGPRLQTLEEIDKNQIQKFRNQALTFADKNPDPNKFESKFLPPELFKEVLKDAGVQFLSGEQNDLLVQIEDILSGGNSRAKALALLDTGRGKSYLIKVIKSYVQKIKEYAAVEDYDVSRFKGLAISLGDLQIIEVNLANQVKLNHLKDAQESLENSLIVIDEDFFIKEKDLRALVNKGAKIVRFGASENAIRILDSIHRVVEKDEISARIKSREVRIARIDQAIKDSSRSGDIKSAEKKSVEFTYRHSGKAGETLQVAKISKFNPKAFSTYLDKLKSDGKISFSQKEESLFAQVIETAKQIIREETAKVPVGSPQKQKTVESPQKQKVSLNTSEGSSTDIIFQGSFQSNPNGELATHDQLKREIAKAINIINAKSVITFGGEGFSQNPITNLQKKRGELEDENEKDRSENKVNDSKINLRRGYLNEIEQRKNLTLEKIKSAEIIGYKKNKAPNAENFHEFVIAGYKKNDGSFFRKTQNIFFGMGLSLDDDLTRQMQQILESVTEGPKPQVFANIVEDGLHKCVIARYDENGDFECFKTEFSTDPNSEFMQASSAEKPAIMIYSGLKNEGVVGIDFGGKSVLDAKQDGRIIFTNRRSDIEVNKLKQAYGRNRGKEVAGLPTKIYVSAEVGDQELNGESIAKIAQDNTEKEEVCSRADDLLKKIKKYFRQDDEEEFLNFLNEKFAGGSEEISKIILGQKNSEVGKKFRSKIIGNYQKFVRDLRLLVFYKALADDSISGEGVAKKFELQHYAEVLNLGSGSKISYVFDSGVMQADIESFDQAAGAENFNPLKHIRLLSHLPRFEAVSEIDMQVSDENIGKLVRDESEHLGVEEVELELEEDEKDSDSLGGEEEIKMRGPEVTTQKEKESGEGAESQQQDKNSGWTDYKSATNQSFDVVESKQDSKYILKPSGSSHSSDWVHMIDPLSKSKGEMTRGDKLRYLKEVYDKPVDVKNIIKDIFIESAKSCDLDFIKVANLIKELRSQNTVNKGLGEYASDTLNDADEAKKIRKFSFYFQQECECCGVYSGREEGLRQDKLVGYRSRYTSDDLLSDLIKNKENLTDPDRKSKIDDKKRMVRDLLPRRAVKSQ